MKKLGPKAKQELVVLVKNSLGRFKTGQALFLDLHASGKYWEQESFIIWAIKQASQKHYETISKQIIRKFPIAHAYTSSPRKPSKAKKKTEPKPIMKRYDLRDYRMIYIGKFKQ